jgi:hypothetical protein
MGLRRRGKNHSSVNVHADHPTRVVPLECENTSSTQVGELLAGRRRRLVVSLQHQQNAQSSCEAKDMRGLRTAVPNRPLSLRPFEVLHARVCGEDGRPSERPRCQRPERVAVERRSFKCSRLRAGLGRRSPEPDREAQEVHVRTPACDGAASWKAVAVA